MSAKVFIGAECAYCTWGLNIEIFVQIETFGCWLIHRIKLSLNNWSHRARAIELSSANYERLRTFCFQLNHWRFRTLNLWISVFCFRRASIKYRFPWPFWRTVSRWKRLPWLFPRYVRNLIKVQRLTDNPQTAERELITGALCKQGAQTFLLVYLRC